MKTIFISAFLFLSITCKATECVERFILLEHLNVSLCQNHSNYRETTYLLIKARAIKLNQFIGKKIESGELKNKKFQISIYDPVMSSPYLELTQNKKNYQILVSGFPSLAELKVFVNYFGEREWKPFSTNSHNNTIAREEIQNFIKKHMFAQKNDSAQTLISIWDKGSLELIYIGDSLRFSLDKKELPLCTKFDLPIIFKNRILFFGEKEIVVFENNSLIKRFAIERVTYRDFDIYPGANWMNICEGSEQNWIYSYSYSDNKLFSK